MVRTAYHLERKQKQSVSWLENAYSEHKPGRANNEHAINSHRSDNETRSMKLAEFMMMMNVVQLVRMPKLSRPIVCMMPVRFH